MWRAANWPLQRILTGIAGAVAGTTAAAIILVYVLTAYEYEQDRIGRRAEFAAAEVSKLVYARLDTWMYQEHRLGELLTSITPASILNSRSLNLRVLDARGAVVVEVGSPVPSPSIGATRPITDGFVVVGRVELTEGVDHIWLHAVPVGIIGLALAIAVFVVLRVLPLRTLLRREAALEAARQETRDSEMQLRLVSDAVPVLIGYVDSNECVRVINKVGEDWYARPRAEILGRSLRHMLPDKLCNMNDPYVTTALSGKAAIFEHTVTYPDGIARRVHGRYIPDIAPDGRVPGYFALIEDVTAQREVEEKLRQAQKAEALGQLTGGIAHDFNNLLGIILGNIELLRDRHNEDPSASVLADAALKACLRGAELTQRLLAFSRKQALTPRVIVVNELIANTAVLLRRTVASSIHIETVLAEDLWPCSVDAGQLENAVINLGINARDAMPEGGRLTIETANVEVDSDTARADPGGMAAGPYVAITLTDSGAGMAAEVVAHAFEPFFTTKDVGKGSGLGLSMVYGFAKQSGGQAKIYSEVGEGTSVRIYLPKAQAGESLDTLDQTGMAETVAGRGETILVVEDAVDLRQVAVAHLQSLGYKVLQAGDGRAALALLKARPDIDLLFTDIVLPNGMHGGEVARQAQARYPALKVLYASGYSRSAIMRRGRLKEGMHFLNKPYRKQDLARSVRAALDEPVDERASA